MGESARAHERVSANLRLTINGRAAGQTRDVSPSGIYFETKSPIKSGGVIRFSLEFDGPGEIHSLECTGEVVRIERLDGNLGVAVKILESRLHRCKADNPSGVHA